MAYAGARLEIFSFFTLPFLLLTLNLHVDELFPYQQSSNLLLLLFLYVRLVNLFIKLAKS